MRRFFRMPAMLVGLSCAQAMPALSQVCTEIAALPATITTQGVHCFKKDLSISITSGNAITVNTSNVVIDLNGFKLGGLGGGTSTSAFGIYALNRQNITIRNGAIRGFATNIALVQSSSSPPSNGHIIEDMRIEAARRIGIDLAGSSTIIRNSFIFDTGSGGGTSTMAIRIGGGRGQTVTGNVISNVVNTVYGGTGIQITGATGALVANNEIHDIQVGILENALGVGVSSSESSRTVVSQNRFVAADGGSYAARLTRTLESCVDNFASGFGTGAFFGCEYANGNRAY